MAKVKNVAGIKVTPSEDFSRFTIDVREAGKVLDFEVFDLALLPPAIQAEVSCRGTAAVLGQRASDATGAIGRLNEMREVWDMWLDGKYRKDRVVGPRVVPAIIEVLATKKNATVVAVQKAWNKLDQAARDKYLEEFKAEIAAVETARETADEVEL